MKQYSKNRQFFQDRIKKGMIGPGSDIIVKEEDIHNEIISDYPLIRYFSGILFPNKKLDESPFKRDTSEVESLTTSNEEEAKNTDFASQEEVLEEEETNVNKSQQTIKKADSYNTSNNFFPTNIGMTFCVPENLSEVEVQFEFGLYDTVKERKIAVDESIYNLFIEHPTFPLKEILTYEDGYMILKRMPKGKSSKGRTEEFKMIDEFKKTEAYKESSLVSVFSKFEQLTRRLWQREPIRKKEKISLLEDNIIEIHSGKITKNYQLSVKCRVKTYKYRNRRYVKIQLVNDSTSIPSSRFSNKFETLNRLALFQTTFTVFSSNIIPYKSYLELNPFDEEAQYLEYIYKDLKKFGIGHNCSVEWERQGELNPKWISTTFLPEHNVLDTKNSFTEEEFPNLEVFDIYDMSIFSTLEKSEVTERLKVFTEAYSNWLEQEKHKIKGGEYTLIEKDILEKIDYNIKRLNKNIKLLIEDEKVYKTFQLANTTMLIQIIISNDRAFGGTEKDLSEIQNYIGTVKYDNLDFFRSYNFDRLSFGRPKYRPFQLAFLLLSIVGIVDENAISRKDVVDLIWFPTGGGKTEAYLAVTAFTIIWRRLKFNTKGYGCSVIMRYTLRLLTAQQFERASKLVVALNFLLDKKVASLGTEPITIGLWVGMASTPNKTSDANEIIKNITKEIDNEGNPDSKNKFQISACPWCGTKLITKNKYDKWVSGFSIKKKKFSINCNNLNCHYHHQLPVNVVDEELYDTPPTILFATVDKFARLAWEPKGFKLFNSHNDSLPPSLIIQDELHLLSGPLGSITGAFESVVEMICTDKENNHIPKIIASTATTRNTATQIKALYGNRKVNIFPPSGLTYKDSFFAKVAQTSKRKYIGFMPTGKTKIDTEMQILAHLLYARIEMFLDTRKEITDKEKAFSILDKYWTIVSYYNSLRDVGRTHNKLGDEISNFTSSLQIRMRGRNPLLNFNYMGLQNRVEELTSRIPSQDIKKVLKKLEENEFVEKKLKKHAEKGYLFLSQVIDLVLATNMISVGIDIDRLNIMLINGQPRNVAEYIQASSRVGRSHQGLVISLLDANRSRDKSYFEHFISFHQAFYKSVEPLSITPFTENTIDKMLTTMVVAYLRTKVPHLAPQNAAQYFEKKYLEEFKKFVLHRFNPSHRIIEIFENRLNRLIIDWESAIESDVKNYKSSKQETGLLKRPSQISEDKELWITMQSMREIDTSSYLIIDLPKRKS